MGGQIFLSKGRYYKRNPRAGHLMRDRVMTECSDYDILWVGSEEESRELYGSKYRARISATEMNRLRRVEMAKVVGERI